MNKIELNKSDNSINKSVARSSSGVSTQISSDGVFVDRDNECQILYGNLFSKFPHPEINVKSKVRSLTYSDFSENNFGTATVDRNISGSGLDSKNRRFSEAQMKSFNKRSRPEKRRSISEDLPNSSNTIDKLLSTLSDLQECHSPNYYNEIDGKFFRNPQVAQPNGEIQKPILSKISLGNLLTNDLQQTLIQKAETNPKDLFFSVLDRSGKLVSSCSLTYSKLLQRAKRTSYYITYKLGITEDGLCVRPGQSVGLVFSPEDAADFLVGFMACMLSKVIAVPVEKPSFNQLASSALTGKYLNQLGVSVILTNLNCFKEITRKGVDIKEIPPWKDMYWVTIDSYYKEKISKNFILPESCSTFDVPLYVEYVYSDQHILHGVPVSLESTLSHCQALKTMCQYKEGQSILCTEDVRHQTGLWHCVLTALYCGMTTFFLPYFTVKKNPISWLNSITKNKIKFIVTSSKVLHHSLSVDKKDLTGIDLSHVISLVVSDACVPWINETLDRFIQRYQSVGLESNAMLPCVSKSETLTICMRRRGDNDKLTSSTLRLCLESLSYDLVKEVGIDSSVMSVVLESSGCLLPTMQAIVVRLNDCNQICREDEIGEICVSSPFSNRVFWMTPDEISSQYLSVNVSLVSSKNDDTSTVTFTRTGLVGFFRVHDGMDNVYIHGSLKNFIEINGRNFNSDDIVGTVSVVKPLGILHKARCCVFTVPVLDHNRLVIALELNTDKYSDDKIYDWISNVLQAVLNLHQLNAYCLIGIPPNTFPKTLLGDINVNDTMNRFLRGTLNITHLTLCPQTAIANLPGINRSSTRTNPFNPASMLAHAIHSQSFASVSGPMTQPISKTSSLIEILEWRATHTPDDPLFSVVNSKLVVIEKITCEQLHKKAERIASLIKDKIKIPVVGSVVAIYLNNPLELTYAIYGCYYLGMVPLVLTTYDTDTLWQPFNMVENLWACKHSKAVLFLTSASTIRLLKSKEYNVYVPPDLWPQLIDIGESPKKKPISLHSLSYPEKQIAFIRLHLDQNGSMNLIGWTHSNIGAICEAHKTQNDLAPLTEVALCLDINSNTGIFLHCISPVYCGHHSFIISPGVICANPDSWLSCISRKSIKHTFCSEYALSQSILATRNDEICSFNKKPCLNLQTVESLIVCVSNRPNYEVIREFLHVFEDSKYGLQTLSIGIDSPWTMGLFVQIPKNSYPRTLYLDKCALRNYRITESEESNDTALEVLELGQPIPNSTVLIVDCQSQYQKSISQLGELWLSSDYAAKSILVTGTQKDLDNLYRNVLNVGSFACDNDTCDAVSEGILSAKLAFGQNIQSTTYVKTGLLGFLRSFGPENQLIVLGKADDCITLRGFTYFPTEIEACINLVDTDLVIQSSAFTESDLLIIVIEVGEFCKSELCFRLIPKVVKSVVENFLLPLGIIQFVRIGEIPIVWNENRRRIKTLWTHKKFDSVLQFYCL